MSGDDDDSSSAACASCGATGRRLKEAVERANVIDANVNDASLSLSMSSDDSDEEEVAVPVAPSLAPLSTATNNQGGLVPSQANHFNSPLQGLPTLSTPLANIGGSGVGGSSALATPCHSFLADSSINLSGGPTTTTAAASFASAPTASPFEGAVLAAAKAALPSTTANATTAAAAAKKATTAAATNKRRRTSTKKKAPNDTSGGATKKAPNGGAEKEKAKKKKEPLPNALINMRAEHMKTKAGEQRFKIVDHYDPKSKQTWRIASEVPTGSDERQNKKVWKLEDLRSEQLRDLARNIGCAGSNISSGGKCLAMKEIAKKVEMGTACANLQIPNPVSNAFQKKVNTVFRCINLMMLAGWNQRTRDLNDRIQRKDYVATGGSSPYKDFWAEFSEALNDAATQDIGTFIGADTDEHGHIQEFIDAGYNLNDFNQVTASWCQSMVRNMFKARENIIVDGITKSGSHDTDLYNFLNKKFLSVTKKETVPGDPVYHLHHRVKEQPGLDGKWTAVLRSCLTSNSTQSPDDDDADDGGNSKKDKFLKAFEETSNKMSEMQAQAAARHAEAQTAARARHEELMDLHKKDIERKKVLDKRNAELAEMDMERKVWDEYTQLMIKVDKLSKGGKSHLLIALSNRALKLEEQLGITEEESAMNDIIKNLDSSDEDGEEDG